MRKYQSGIAHIWLIFAIVIAAIATSTWYLLSHRPSEQTEKIIASQQKDSKIDDYAACVEDDGSKVQETYPEVCVTVTGERFTNPVQKPIPTGWKLYENNDIKIKFAYPSYWESKGTFTTEPPTWKVDTVSEHRIGQGCLDCDLRYDSESKKWIDWTDQVRTDITPVMTVKGTQVFIVPVKGAFNCGSSEISILYKSHFIYSRLAMCAPPERADDFEPTNGQLLTTDVEKDIATLLRTLTELQ